MILILSHWDSDGICSAAYLGKILEGDEELSIATPEIGEYRIDEKILEIAEEASRIYVLDLNFPSEVSKLPKGKEVLYYDHHSWKGPPHGALCKNPVYSGEDPEKWPSTTWVLYEEFGIPSAKVPIGAIGDIGPRALEGPRGEENKRLLSLEGISLEGAREIVRRLDSLSISLDRKGVEEIAEFLIKNEVREVLRRRDLEERRAEVQRRINDAIRDLREVRIDGILASVASYSEEWLIASKVARKIVWDLGYNIGVVFQRSERRDYLYLRRSPSLGIDLVEICKFLEADSCGGKSEVIGATFPPGTFEEKEEEIWEKILEKLRKSL